MLELIELGNILEEHSSNRLNYLVAQLARAPHF